MKKDATLATMKLATAGLAAGTAIEGYVQGSRIFGETIAGVIAAVLFACFMVVIFDRTGTKNLFALGQHFTGQERLGRGVLIVAIIGVFGFVGSMTFSLLSIPVIADVANGDTKADDRIQEATTRAQSAYEKAIASADAQIADARRVLAEAMAAEKTARKRAIDAQGGEFARLANDGNSWVWIDEKFRKQRRNIEALEARAREDVREARAALSMAENAKARLIANGAIDEGTMALIATQKTRFQNWVSNRQNTRSVTLVLTVGCGLLVLLMLARQIAAGRVEECRTISDVVGDALEDIHDAVIDVGDGAGKAMAWAKMKTHGIVSSSSVDENRRGILSHSVHPVEPTVYPPDSDSCPPMECIPHHQQFVPLHEKLSIPPHPGGQIRTKYPPHVRRQIEKLRDNIKKYNRRAKEGTITTQGMITLSAWQKQLEEIKAEYKNRS